LAQLFGVQGDITAIARMGSGSACRSLFGGFVKWEMGSLKDGSDSIAVQVKDSDHWEDMHVLIMVVNDQQKQVSSTEGMINSTKTSRLLKHRAEEIVPVRMKEMEKAIEQKDFSTFADLTMKDSDNFHDCCADTTPPIHYLNEVSHSIKSFVRSYNEVRATENQKFFLTYTFDAGPNACLFLEKKDLPQVVSLISHFFPNDVLSSQDYFKSNDENLWKSNQSDSNLISSKMKNITILKNKLKYIIHTSVGPGPMMDTKESLIQLF